MTMNINAGKELLFFTGKPHIDYSGCMVHRTHSVRKSVRRLWRRTRRLNQHRGLMDGIGAVPGSCDDVLRLVYCVWRSMNDQQELVGLQGHVVLDDTVFGNTDADQACSSGTHAANNNRASRKNGQ